MKKTKQSLARLLRDSHTLTTHEFITQYKSITKDDLNQRLKQHRRMKINP